jgi:hypothetical protein
VEISGSNGQKFTIQALVNEADTEVEITLPFAPTKVVVDPFHENLVKLTTK